MEIWLVLARLLLAAVFGAAGVAKLADRDASQQTFINFGVPDTLVKPLIWLLPIAEIITALALISTQFAWWGAIAALALLLLFIVGIGANLVRGKTPDCNCFGQLHSTPIGWQTVTRNLFLSLVAVFIIAPGKAEAGTDILGWTTTLTIAERANLLVGIAGLALLLAIALISRRMLKQQSLLLKRLEALEEKLADDDGIATTVREDAILPTQQLPIGAPAPAFAIMHLRGETVTLTDLLEVQKPLLLFFVAPSCAPCTALLSEIVYWQRAYAERLTVALLSKGAVAENQQKFAESGIHHLLVQNEAEVSDAYHAKWTPGALLIKPDGTIGSHMAYGSEEIKKLVHHTVQANGHVQPWTSTVGVQPAQPPGGDEGTERLKIGDKVPARALQDLTGKTVDLATFLDQKTLLLFWSPGCGFCQQMLDDLKMLESLPSAQRPQILLISTGTIVENLKLQLTSPILLDKDFSTGKLFGSTGTPSAVLVDENGKLTSTVGVGKLEILAFVRVQAADLLSNSHTQKV